MQQSNQDQGAKVKLTLNGSQWEVLAKNVEAVIRQGIKHHHYDCGEVEIIVNDPEDNFVVWGRRRLHELSDGYKILVLEGGPCEDGECRQLERDDSNYSRNSSSERSQRGFLNLSNTFGPNFNRNRHSEGLEKASFRSLQAGFQALDTTGKGKSRHISVSPSPSVMSQASGQSYSRPGPSNLNSYKNKRVWSPSTPESQMKRRHREELEDLQERQELEASHLNYDGQGSEYSQVTGFDRASTVDPIDGRSFLSRLSSDQGNQQVNNGSPSDSTRSYGTVPRNFDPQPSSDDDASHVRSHEHHYDSDASTSTAGQKNKVPPAKPTSKVQPISISYTDPLPSGSTGNEYIEVLVTEIPARLWDQDMVEFKRFLGRQQVYRQDVFWIEDPDSVKYKALLYVARTKAEGYMKVIMSPKHRRDRNKNYGMKANYYE